MARFCEIDEAVGAVADPTTPDELVAVMGKHSDMAEAAAAVAPEEIRDEVRLVADEFGEMADLDDGAEIAAAVESLGPAFEEASDQVDAWGAENC